MSQDRLRALPVALFFLLAAVVPLAGAEPAEPWEAGAFAADPAAVVQAASRIDAGSGEGGVIILFSETRYSYGEDGRATRVRRMVYRILNAGAGPEWSAIEEHWAPWYQERPQLQARVITPDGAVHSLDPALITEAARAQAPEMFEDGRTLRAPLPATGPGAIVETEVTSRDKAPFFDRGTVELLPVRQWVPVRHARLSVEAPAALPVRHVIRALPEGFREETLEGRRRLTFEYRGLSAYGDEFELGMPPDVRWISYVGFSTAPSWSAVAQRYSEIVEEAIRQSEGTGALRAFLRSADVPAKTPRETIDRILARMGAEVRYTGVELGEGSIIPRPPAETLRRKFGDCKDKAVLLAALLRMLDIPAHVALLRAGEHWPDVEESLPGMGSFNHAIVVVPGTPELWIDPTDRYARAGELPAGDQGRLALIASPTAEGLVRTPEATAADNRETETREFFLSDLGPARVVETNEFWGAAERDLRSFYATQDAKAVRESLTGYLNTAYLTEKLEKIDHSDPADLSRPFRLRLEAEEAKRGFTDVQNAVVAVFPAAALSRLPEELKAGGEDEEPRRSEYYFTRPFSAEVRYRIVPPVGFRPQPLPPGRVRQLGPATLSEEYAAQEDGTVTATVRFEIGKRRITAEEFEALRKGAGEVNAEDAVMVYFEQVGEALLAAGRVREALEELGRLAALSPKKPLPRARIARALLAGGMGESAREEARRAVDLEPSFAPAWRDLGWILQHDEVGRRFGEGFDRAGAIAAYRKAKELDPQDGVARADLAILLEHDEKGRRYAQGADLAAAIDEYRALRADLDEKGMDDNLAFALLHSGRFEEMKTLLAELETTDTRSTLRLVAVAATEGASAAAREAERKFSDLEARRAALKQAAGNLVQARLYPLAAVLLEQAGRQAPNAAAILVQVERLRKTRRHEELSYPPDQPAGMTRRFLVLLGSGEPDPQAFLAFFSRSLVEVLGKDEKARRELQDTLASLEGFTNDGEVQSDVALDMELATLRETVTGDDTSGYRVSFATALGKETVYYVVREEGGYKLAGSNAWLGMLGLEALRRLERGDLPGARQWLDWTREELRSGRGDDPLDFAPSAVLWTRGADATADDARCAAASLLSGSYASEKAVPLLLACRESAPEGERRTAIELALAHSYWHLDRYADMADSAQRLSSASPGSERAYNLLNTAFTNLGRWDEVRRLAEQRLAAIEDDPEALEDLYYAAEARGDLEEAEKHLQRIVDAGKASSTVFNNLAWLALFRNKVDERAVEQAQRAVMLDKSKDPFDLHTLASLYAELGKTAEAYQVILQSLEVGAGAPDSDDWFVFGRLAEHYGLREAARRYYERVMETEDDFTSTYDLARKRLSALGPEAKEAKRTRRR